MGKGLKVEEIQAYYDEAQFKDWTHAETGAPVLKAQHPEFELWNQGIHARSGVTCADCHMPYKRDGALKISDHHVRSPVLNINRACQTCHKWPEEELKARVETIQERTFKLRNVAMDALMDLIKRSQGGEGRGQERRRAGDGAGFPAQGAVLSGLRRGGKLDRLPRAAGSRAHSRRVDRFLQERSERAARWQRNITASGQTITEIRMRAKP